MTNPSFYTTTPTPSGYGKLWLLALRDAGPDFTKLGYAEIVTEDGETLHLEIGSDDEARYWSRRFLCVNGNRFCGYEPYTLLVVSVDLPSALVTFKLDVSGHNRPVQRFEVLSF